MRYFPILLTLMLRLAISQTEKRRMSAALRSQEPVLEVAAAHQLLSQGKMSILSTMTEPFYMLTPSQKLRRCPLYLPRQTILVMMCR